MVCPLVDAWSLGVTFALVAWSCSAEPGCRGDIRPREWHKSAVRLRHLNRVAPCGSFLRKLMDRLLSADPPARQFDLSLAYAMFDEMKQCAGAMVE